MSFDNEFAEALAQPGCLVGSAMERREDPDPVTGRVWYTDDISVPGMTHLMFARSPYRHADVTSIDTSAAEAMDGVVAVFTWEDVEASDSPGRIRVEDMVPMTAEVPGAAVMPGFAVRGGRR